MVKSGLEKIFLKFLHAQTIFLIHKNAQIGKFSNKNDLLCAWWDFNKFFCDVCTYDKCNFKPQISSIFHFDRASDG